MINYKNQDEFYHSMAMTDKKRVDEFVYQITCFMQQWKPEEQMSVIGFMFLCMVDRLNLSPTTILTIMDNVRRGCNMPSMRAAWDFMNHEW